MPGHNEGGESSGVGWSSSTSVRGRGHPLRVYPGPGPTALLLRWCGDCCPLVLAELDHEPYPVLVTATAAYPYGNRDRATAAIRGRPRENVARAGAEVSDWTTLIIEGPTEVEGLHRRVRFDWTAAVEPDRSDPSPHAGRP
jgi:hypothetical protein